MIILNPEFHRNLWLKFSPFRLIAMPVLLFFVLAIFASSDEDWLKNIFHPAVFMYCVIVLLWGNYEAAAALPNEIKNNTWDFQKMSSIGAWQLAIGKLLGATSYVWYFGIALLVLIGISYGYQTNLSVINTYDHLTSGIITITYMILAGVAGHVFAFLASINNFKYHKNNIIAPFTLGVFVSSFVFSSTENLRIFALRSNPAKTLTEVNWHGFIVEHEIFVILSILFFLFWAIAGIHRNMREELQFRNAPVVWLFFLGTLAIYTTGFVDNMSIAKTAKHLPTGKMFISFILTLFLAYCISFTEARNLSKYKRWIFSIKAKQWKKAFEDTPAWLASLLLVIPFYILVNLWTPAVKNEILGFSILSLTTSLILFAARDIIVLHTILLGNHVRHSKFVLLFYYLMVYALLPFLCLSLVRNVYSSNLELYKDISINVTVFFFPVGMGSFYASCIPVFIQALIAGYCLNKVLKSMQASRQVTQK